MVRKCSECGKEGGFFDFDIKHRSLPLSKERILCSSCYNNIYPKENAEYQQIMQWKSRILRLFYEGTVKQFCHEQGISTMEKRWTTAVSRKGTRYQRQYNYYFTYEELVAASMKYVGLQRILDFAKKKGVPVHDIELEIDQYKSKKKQMEKPAMAPEINDSVINRILEKIDQFKPLLPNYPNELSYQLDLGRYLLQYFPTAQLEQQRSSARPDIVIDNIAIEIKGPTYQDGLRSIADKCFRYPLYFEKGLIIVLFDVKVTSRSIDDLKKGLQNKFPHVVIRCK